MWTWINREWFKPSVITLKSADGRHFKTAGPERSDDQDFGWNARQSEAHSVTGGPLLEILTRPTAPDFHADGAVVCHCASIHA
jgi:hypothetical protein